MNVDELGPFETVFDVGGNVGEFAERCKRAWPNARVVSFEPMPQLARANEKRAALRWTVEPVALSSSSGRAVLHYCTNQHSASTMMEPGTTRRERFNIRDQFEDVEVRTRRLDEYRPLVSGRTLLKVDVEGHELEVLRGALHVLELVDVAVIEVNQDRHVFVDAPAPAEVDRELREHELEFAGVLGVQLAPAGDVVQFDGIWTRR